MPSETRDSPRAGDDGAARAGDEGVADPLTARIADVPGPDPSARSLVRARLFDQDDGAEIAGRYQLVRFLGSGGMGVVYAAHDTELERDVALKLVVTTRKDDPETLARMRREAVAMARLSHPSVVQVYDVGRHEDRVYLAMEYVRGQTLADWLRDAPDGEAVEDSPTPSSLALALAAPEGGADDPGARPLTPPIRSKRPWRAVVDVFLRAGEGLAAAHAQGMVHRDFKPGNVIVGEDGRARILDFGLARAFSRESEPEPEPEGSGPRRRRRHDSLQDPITIAGSIIGTPSYMSPEQYLRQPVDARSDQFSFCVALYEALYGRRPFPGRTLSELTRSVLSGRLADPPRRRRVPGWLHAAVLRGLSFEPQKRWPSMHELLMALRHDRVRRSRLLAAALALSVIVIAVLVTVLVLG